ncbi:hypothetical protein MUA01_15365 [Enterobacteriaceae bacterium H18W14]|uniref:hypothetical protein n=1 Tax=Dryocola boscaweniae TaxID=2925397 RepID=UPI0022EFEF0B|nr:hypothetical protein [Dryocola boscaweniae]MCT4716341.1 hypothetical protein [Dryocola boscaweniae]
MGLLTWVIIGALVGIAVNRLRPASGGGFAVAQVLAVTGALIGGYVCAVFNIGTLATLEPTSLLAALAGSLLFLFVFRKLRMS